MIVQERIKIGTKAFVRTYSDCGFLIERGGVQYAEAIDPVEIGRVYFQTRIPIKGGEKE